MKDWIPLLQTLAWIGLIIYGARKFSAQLEGLFGAIQKRVSSGSLFKVGPVELGEDLKALEKVNPSAAPKAAQEVDWSKERNGIYQENCGIFLAHVIEPSEEKGQIYDIFIYLVRHKSEFFDDLEYAEFFLGEYWGNKVYRETQKNGMIGITTSAYGPFLCTCRVKMRNGKEIRLNRYIDFEMGRVFREHG
ncbi:MAG: hypothetical protein KZQ99_08450 [Candidatus Thiodiazotropha sp. (ex Dulcina madagascariensis)]|nr:hypothetical protein [Candidatus Thiodiazotropha sp. (ex Epidulcina cf. delphinae)]MCU7934895.1 hypothetical protein [Candidatus Thiodiazotropha sp. (ex Dulcina madagascariensis)]